MILNLTSQQFNSKIHEIEKKMPIVFKGDKPVVIDFYADWCAPCHAIKPIIEKMSEEFLDVNFYKVNVESIDSSELTKFFKIRAIPTIVYIPFSPEKTFFTSTGAISEAAMRDHINDIM